MNISVKKFSKKSLSLLIALIMVFSALPLTLPISADAAETKTEISVWDASNASLTEHGNRFVFADGSTNQSFTGVEWGSQVLNSGYASISNATGSFGVISSGSIDNEWTTTTMDSSGFASKGINGSHWSFSAKFAFTDKNNTNANVTIFGIGTSKTYTYSHANAYLTRGQAADIVDLRKDGRLFIGDASASATTLTTDDFVSTDATSPKTVTVEYNNGSLSLSVDGVSKYTTTVTNTELFEMGVSNYFVGAPAQVYSGGNFSYYAGASGGTARQNGDKCIFGFNLYSLSGATYVEPSDISNHGNLTLHWLYSKDYTKDSSKNSYDIDSDSISNVTWGTTNDVPSLTFNGNSSVQRSFGQTISSTGISSSIESGGAGVTIAFMAYTNNTHDKPFFTIYGDRTEFSYSPSGRILYRNSSYSSSNSSATQNIERTSAISTGTWHKIVIVLKASKSMDVYVDNSTAIKSITNNAFYDNNTWSTTHTIKLGANKDGTEKFNGAIRDFRIYNKSLTTSADITSLMSDMESNKANTKSYNVSAVSAYGLLGKSAPGTERLQNGDMNVVNDGYTGNTTIGILRIPLSDFQTGERAGSESKLLLNVASTWYNTNSNQSSSIKSRYDNDLYTDVYYTTNDVSNYVSSSGTRSALSTIALNTDYSTSIATVKSNVAKLGADDTTKIGSIPHTTIGQYSLDVANAINATLNAGKKDLYIILVKNAVDGYGNNSNGPWTDTHFLINQQVISYTKVRNYIFEDFAGNKVKEVQASSAMEAAEYTPTEVTPTSYEPPIDILSGHTKYTYYWPDTPTNNVFKEQRRSDTEDCTNEFVNVTPTTHDVVCRVCGHTETLPHAFKVTSTVQPDDVNNGYTEKTCSNCQYSKNEYLDTDWSTYDSQKRVLDVLLADGSKFTAASLAACRNDYNTATSGVTSGDETKSQTFIDNKVKKLIAAKDLLKSTVTLNIYDFSSGNPILLGNSAAKDVKYLNTETLSIPKEYQEKYTVYQWKINNKGVDKVIGSNSYSINAIVNDNVTYNVYLKKNAIDEAEAATKAVVTLVNKSNNAIDIAYITKSDTAQTTTVDCGNRTITIGGVALTAPKYAFYDLIGFNVNGTVVYDTAEIVINDNITIRPIYSASSTLQIDCASAVSINGKAVQSYQAKWDEPIVIKANREVVWYTVSNGNEIILAKGDTFRFRANENIVILTKDVPQTLEACAKIGYFKYDVELNKVTVVNNFFVPEGKTVRAAGVILSTKTNDIEQMKKQSTGKFIVDPSKFTENGNQVRISVTRTANNAFNMHALAYVEFTDGTVCYSKEVVTCSYTPA